MPKKLPSKEERRKRIGKGVKAAPKGTFSKRTEKMATYPKQERTTRQDREDQERRLHKESSKRKKK